MAGKHRDCAQVGIASLRRELPADASHRQVEAVIDELNADSACTGYIVARSDARPSAALRSQVLSNPETGSLTAI